MITTGNGDQLAEPFMSKCLHCCVAALMMDVSMQTIQRLVQIIKQTTGACGNIPRAGQMYPAGSPSGKPSCSLKCAFTSSRSSTESLSCLPMCTSDLHPQLATNFSYVASEAWCCAWRAPYLCNGLFHIVGTVLRLQ